MQNGCLHFKVRHNKSFADFCQLHHSSLYSSSRAANVLSSLKKRKTICSNCHETTFFLQTCYYCTLETVNQFSTFWPFNREQALHPDSMFVLSFVKFVKFSNIFLLCLFSWDIFKGYYRGIFQGIFQGISSWDFSKGFFHGIFLKDFFMEFL